MPRRLRSRSIAVLSLVLLIVAAPPPIGAQAPAGSSVLVEDFSDPARQTLFRGATPDGHGQFDYVDGEYLIRNHQPPSIQFARLAQRSRAASLAVDARLLAAESDGAIVLGCRVQPAATATRGYYLHIEPRAGTVVLQRYDGGLRDATVLAATRGDALRPNPQRNRIELVCDGADIVAAVNGVPLVVISDDRYAEGELVLGVEARTAPTEARFDNLVVTPLPRSDPSPALTVRVDPTEQTAVSGDGLALAVTLIAGVPSTLTLTEQVAVWTACVGALAADPADCSAMVVDWSRQVVDPPLRLEMDEQRTVSTRVAVPPTLDCRRAGATVRLHLLWQGTAADGASVQASSPAIVVRCPS
jgi:hypothetical protein